MNTLVTSPAASPCVCNHPILVVDDNRDAADSLAQLFAAMGAKASVAYCAKEALTAMMSGQHRMAFIDISMPVMDGYELAARIRACDSLAGVVLIALTGWAQDPVPQGVEATGFDHRLAKPADLHQLTQLLESIA